MRMVLAAGLSALMIATQAWATEPAHKGRAMIQAAVDACRHYENRARFMPRSGDVGFVTVLAEACAQAGVHAVEPGPHRTAAMRFLLALGQVRAEIAAIDADRMRAPPLRSAGAVRDLRASRGLVTETGEFLILRHAGVFAALDDWVATGADFELAAALP
ncbi:MAG: hypothetical protein ACK4WC_11965 [Rubrimonas sp.]